MRTTMLHSAEPLAQDHALMARLDPLREPVADDRAAICLGIEGPQGGLYRVIETTSLVEAVRLFEILRDFGLRACAGRRGAGWSFTRVFRVAGELQPA
jgi:hypothetical protein